MKIDINMLDIYLHTQCAQMSLFFPTEMCTNIHSQYILHKFSIPVLCGSYVAL